MRLTQLFHKIAMTVMSVSVIAFGFGFARNASAAAYATGGTSPYRDQVLWLTWGGGTNGTAGVALSNGDSTSANLSLAGSTLAVNCSISNITRVDSSGGPDGGIQSYRPGNWVGDGLDNLYNIGGGGSSNQLIAGINNGAGAQTYRFDVTCSASLGGVAYDLPGLVVADAEQSSTGEYVQGTADGSWTIVERTATGGCVGVSYDATLSASGTNEVLRMGAAPTRGNCPTAGAGPMGVSFLNFDSTAYAGVNRQVTMTFELHGGGKSAIAIGLLAPYADSSDAPTSYGMAVHSMDPAMTADGLAVGNTADIMAAGFTLGTITNPATDRLGAQVDSDGAGLVGNVGATTDDTTDVDDEDAVNIGALPRLGVVSDGQTYTVPVSCTGTGSVAGWIDFNVDGDFADTNERSTNTPACTTGGGTVNLTFTVPSGANLVAGQSYLRVRYSLAPATDLNTPSGAVRSGEVEDHALTILPATVKIQKSTSGGTGSFSFATTNLATTPVVVATTSTNPNTSLTNAIQTTAAVTLTETVPANWALSSATCTDANSAVTGNTGNFGSLAGAVLTIPTANVVPGADITCNFTNQKVATLTLRKQWSGATVGDDATVTVSRGSTQLDSLASDAGTANELDTDTTPVTVNSGDVLTLAETLPGTNAGLYNRVVACTGTSGLSGTTLTVGNADSAIVCTYTNTRQQADLRITKTNTPGVNGNVDQSGDTVVRGAGTTYTIVVTNLGPDPVTGAVVRDTPISGLTCNNNVACSGTACPGATVPLSSLQSSGGVALGTLANSGTATFTLSCTVQ